MKKRYLLFASVLFLCFIGVLQGQNTFPTNGNVGIGTTTPQQKLHVHSSNFSALLISGLAPGVLFSPTSTSSSFTAAIGLTTSSSIDHYLTGSNYGDLNMRSSVGGRLLFGTLASASGNGTIRMEIGNTGKVNIGSGYATDPYSLLNVEGAISSTGAMRTPAVKLGHNLGELKLRRYNNGEDMTFKTALAPSNPSVAELYVNYNGAFSNGTRIMGSKMIVDGDLGIGTSDTRGYELAVKGKILSEELKIRTFANWPDYVFDAQYELKSLSELEAAIKKNGHLPNLPSAEEVKENGFNVSEMNASLLEKVEELTLYLIELDKKVAKLEQVNAALMSNYEKE